MAGFTDAAEIEVLNEKFRTVPMEAAIHTADPTEAGLLTNEIAVTRASVSFTDPAVSMPISNVADTEWDNIPDDGTDPLDPGTTITHVSVHRVSDGVMIAYEELGSLVRVPETETARIPAGGLVLELL